MILFGAGALLGFLFGFFVAALLATARQSEEAMGRMHEEQMTRRREWN